MEHVLNIKSPCDPKMRVGWLVVAVTLRFNDSYLRLNWESREFDVTFHFDCDACDRLTGWRNGFGVVWKSFDVLKVILQILILFEPLRLRCLNSLVFQTIVVMQKRVQCSFLNYWNKDLCENYSKKVFWTVQQF